MFDTMTLTKATGAVCGSLLVFLLGSWAADVLYSSDSGYGDERVQGFVIDTGTDGAAQEQADEAPDFAALFAAANIESGERAFNKCRACHVLEDGQNGIGPHLYGVVGREVASVDGFGYSGALRAVADVWTAEELYAFLENPSRYAPGTSMAFAGLGRSSERVDLIAYMDLSDGTNDIVFEVSAEAPAEETANEEVVTEEAPAEEAVTEEAPAEEAPAEEAAVITDDESAFAAMVASADIEEGQKVYRRCAACHAVDPGQNKVGPTLYGVVGADIAAVEGFNYSDALQELEGEWTVDRLSDWLENPRAFAPGNRMGFPGLKGEQDRANVIGYMQSLSD